MNKLKFQLTLLDYKYIYPLYLAITGKPNDRYQIVYSDRHEARLNRRDARRRQQLLSDVGVGVALFVGALATIMLYVALTGPVN